MKLIAFLMAPVAMWRSIWLFKLGTKTGAWDLVYASVVAEAMLLWFWSSCLWELISITRTVIRERKGWKWRRL